MTSLTATTLYSHEGTANTAIAPATTAEQVQINDEDGVASNLQAEIVALRQKIASAVDSGIHFKGVVTSESGLPTVGYKAGWQYSVKEAGTYAGVTCEVGDLILCIKDYASGSAANSDWSVLQANIVGAVSGPASAVVGHVAAFDNVSGKVLKDSGFTVAKSVPADAKFSDTTYDAATDSADGLLTAGLHKKLVNIEEGADKTDATNVSAAGAFMKTDTADSISDGTSKVIMTSAERTKLSGITAGAEANQNAYAKVKVGATTLAASAKQDTLTIEAGEGVTLTVDETNKKVTLSETYIDSCVVSSLDDVPSNLRNGGIVILKE